MSDTHCGHPSMYIMSGKEGTSYCMMCESLGQREQEERMLLALEILTQDNSVVKEIFQLLDLPYNSGSTISHWRRQIALWGLGRQKGKASDDVVAALLERNKLEKKDGKD